MLMYFYAKILRKMRGIAVKNSCVDRTSKIESGCALFNSKVGRYTFFGYDCEIINCTIGGFCSVSSFVTVGGIAHPMEFVSTSPVFLSHKDSVKKKFARHEYLPSVETVIGNDVWIGKGAYLKAGVTIGHGAVIGMGAVVTKSVAPYAVVAGNPAKIIRMRFEQEVIEALLKLEWWNWSDSQLAEYGCFFDNPHALLREKGLL